MTCIGIDPASTKRIAFAYRRGTGWMVGKGPLAKDVASFADIFEVSRLHGVDTAVIEDGYVGKNPRVALALAMVRGSLAALAQQAGLRPVLVAPATWQTAMLSQGGWRPTTHKEIIPLVKLRVRSLHKLDLAEDEAVAVLLAEWGDAQRINAG